MVDLAELEIKLSQLSHTQEAVSEIVAFCLRMRDTPARMALWNSTNAIVRKPIDPEEARELGFDAEDDRFVLLQGDIVRTEAAFHFGERITGSPKYAVLNSSCDLVPGRAYSSILLRIVPIEDSDPEAKKKLSQLLKFSRRDAMYIPPLPDDPISVVGNVVNFDGACQIRTEDLLLATRVASLSLIGWRIFASFARAAIIRANPREVEMRKAVETGTGGLSRRRTIPGYVRSKAAYSPIPRQLIAPGIGYRLHEERQRSKPLSVSCLATGAASCR